MKKQSLFIGIVMTIIFTLGIIMVVQYIPIPGLQRLKQGKVVVKPKQQDNECEASKSFSSNSASGKVIDVKTENQVKKMSKNKHPMIIKFYSNWCPACIAAKKPYPAIAKKFKGKVGFYAVNVEDKDVIPSMEKAGLLDEPVHAIPTFVFIKNGKVKHSVRGFPGEAVLEAVIKDKLD